MLARSSSFGFILERLRQARSTLATNCRIDIYGISGSMARGDNSSDSDIDIAVRAVGRIGFFEIVEAKEYLEEILKKPVDLVFPEALPANRKSSFERDLITL